MVHKPTRKGSDYPDHYLFKGSNYEELFHWAAQDNHDWTEKARTGNKRCFLDGTRVLLDNTIVVALFDPENKRVLRVTDVYSPPVVWSIKWCIQRAFEHWEILDTQSETVEDALDVLKSATRKYIHKRSNSGEWPEEFALERYENTCKFFGVSPDMHEVVAYKDARQAWRDRSEEWQKKRQAKEDAEEQRRHEEETKVFDELRQHVTDAGLISDNKSYSQKYKAVANYHWPEELRQKCSRFFSWSTQMYGGYVQRLLGFDNIDAVWVNHKRRSFLTSRGVIVAITDDLIKLIELVIKATPEQREKFTGRHVGNFCIIGFTDSTVRVGCHTFLLSDLPALIEEWNHPSDEDVEEALKELRESIAVEERAIKEHQEKLQKLLTEAIKRGITITLDSQEETKED